MKDPNNPCLFCNSKYSGIAHENKLAYVSYDTYPVSELHCLIIPKRHIKDYFELNDDELSIFDRCLRICLYFKFLNSGFCRFRLTNFKLKFNLGLILLRNEIDKVFLLRAILNK